jgi:hypothetical protein
MTSYVQLALKINEELPQMTEKAMQMMNKMDILVTGTPNSLILSIYTSLHNHLLLSVPHSFSHSLICSYIIITRLFGEIG